MLPPPIFCGNVEFDARQSELERIFAKYGKVERIDMKSGFAFIYMEDERDAEYAIRRLDRREFGRHGRKLRVEWSKQEQGSKRSASERRSTANSRPSKTLFVINFDPINTRMKDLERHFEAYGKVLNVRIKKNFAFIQFEFQDEATKALEATNMSKLMDRVISVEYAVRDDDANRNGHYPESDRRGRDRSLEPERRARDRSPEPERRARDRSPEPERRARDRSPKPDRRERERTPEPDRRERDRSLEPDRRERDRSPKPDRRERDRSPKPDRRERDRSPEPDRRRRYRSPEPDRKERVRSLEPDKRGKDRSPESDGKERIRSPEKNHDHGRSKSPYRRRVEQASPDYVSPPSPHSKPQEKGSPSPSYRNSESPAYKRNYSRSPAKEERD